MVGPFKVVTVAGQGPLARDFFEPHVAKIAPIIRGSEDLFQGHVWEFFYGWGDKPVFVDAEEVHYVRMSRRYSRERVNKSIEASLAIALHQVLPEDAAGLGSWATLGSLFPEDDLSWVYRALAFNRSLAGVRCLEGEIQWCWEAVGLANVMEVGSYWDSPVQRRRLVESRYLSTYRAGREVDQVGVGYSLVRGCLHLKVDRACVLLLSGYQRQPGRSTPRPSRALTGRGKGTLAAEALRIGGEGSFGRLISRPEDSIRDRIAFAAGVPAENVMAAWVDRVRESRPNAQAGLLRSPPTLLVWLLLMIVFATRSVRWRLG
jgi:hypothetical protein